MIRIARLAIAAAIASLGCAAGATTIDYSNPTWILFDLQTADLAPGVSSISFDFTTTGHETDLQLSIVDLGVAGDMISATLDNAAVPVVTTSLVSAVNNLSPTTFALENTTGTDVFVNIGTRRAPIIIPCDYANLAGPYASHAGQCASAARAASYSFVSFFPLNSIRTGTHTLTLQLTQTDLVNGLPKGSYGLVCLNPDQSGLEHCGSPISIPVPEPTSGALLLAGLAALGAIARRRRAGA
jgi:hypothetical protein